MFLSNVNKDTLIDLGQITNPKEKSYEKTIKVLKWTVIAGVAYIIYANYLSSYVYKANPLKHYFAHRDYIRNAIMCDKGYELPGCENRIYCTGADPAFYKKHPGTGTLESCINKPILDAPIMLEDARQHMKYDIKKYMESRNFLEKIYDDAMDLLYPAKPEQPTKKMSVEEYREMQDRLCGRQQEA